MKSRPLLVFAGFWLGALGLVAAGMAIVFVTRGDLLAATVASAGAVFMFGTVIPLFKIVPGRVIPVIQPDDAGTTFRPDSGIDVPVQVSLAGLVLTSALIVLLLPMGKLGIPAPPFMRYQIPFVAAGIVVVGLPVIWRNLRRGSTKYLRLTPEGFEIAEGWRHQGSDWASVVDVTSGVAEQNSRTSDAIIFVMTDDVALTLSAGSITAGGLALRELVRFYWQHPEYRDELTDGRAVRHLADPW